MRRAGEIVTGKFVHALLENSGLPPSSPKDLTILDNACGSGVVTAVLLEKLSEEQKKRTRVTCGDVQQVLIDYVKGRMEREKWEDVEVRLVDAQDTKLPSVHYTHVLTSFAPVDALQEIHRILVPGGVNAFTTWHTTGWVLWLQRAFAAIPGCPPFPTKEQYGNHWDTPEFLQEVVAKQGFVDVKVVQKADKPVIDSPEMYVRLFANMILGLATKWFTDEQKKEYTEKIKATLLKQLQEEFGEGQPVEMPMIANIVTCKKAI
ncbi:S-adenosyl-L-methionine-dependent methyltransferase [Calocera viscosa TUFC12733]|uniref:S-adenosyl-L-methionine-dependent methyltransferase n=1 Tax=Calocera viscosa (strain TUFC12733) TaxID=1330018 RepID=A0A167G4D8_CALVF|nr:S-adenosyl-L-methionine-dependent methyltransferase [Calocera viscosa TUFC12733]